MKTGLAITLAIATTSFIAVAQADEPAAAEKPAAEAKESAKPKAPAKAARNVYEVGVKVAECKCCGKANGNGVREALFKLDGVKRVTFQTRSGVAIIRMKDQETKVTKESIAAIFAAQKLEHASVKYIKAIKEPARRSRPSLEDLNKEEAAPAKEKAAG